MVVYSKLLLASLLLLPAQTLLVVAYEDTCTPFPAIYKDGTELCQVMWNGAFEVVDDETKGYTMWFFDHENNPNEAVTRTLFGENTTVDQCHLDYFHKSTPSSEGEEMTECHPWKKRSCCDKGTVPSVTALNENYGAGYHWNRCGPMSQACERFFVMEACLYECEPAAGLFRKFNDSQQDEEGFNKWQIHKMPIQKSFCNAWYDACRADYFCGNGDYFACQEYYEANQQEQELAAQKAQEAELAALKAKEAELGSLQATTAAELGSLQATTAIDKTQFMIAIWLASAVAGIGLLVSVVLVWKEKSGTPLFAAVEGNDLS